MKRFLLCLILLTFAWNASALTPAEIAAWKIPGECKGEPANQQCAKYAFCLNLRLAEAGVEAHALAYHWSREAGAVTHAVVFFKLGAQWWAIDNQDDTAVKVAGKTDLAKMKCFDHRAWKIQGQPFYKDSGRYLTELAATGWGK
jgi:hypothetical protein